MATIANRPVDALLEILNENPAARWNFPLAVGSPLSSPGGIGKAISLTYSFPTTPSSYFSRLRLSGFRPFAAEEQDAVRQILSTISGWFNIQFQELPTNGQLSFAYSSQPLVSGGFAFMPGFSYSYTEPENLISSISETDEAGDVWLNGDLEYTASDWLPGGKGHSTIQHEVGHALGLKHPFDGKLILRRSLDNERYTVMSYTEAKNVAIVSVSGTPASYTTSTEDLIPGTLMPLDFETLSYLYGTNPSYRTDDTTYRWDPDAEILETIYDAGGTDTIDASNQRLSCVIDLRAGDFSSIGIRSTNAQKRSALGLPPWFRDKLPKNTYDGRDNLAIAAGVTIENALGGSAKDILIGNDDNNLLCGGLGRDHLTGGGSSDSDSFLFQTAPSAANRDRILDYTPGRDRILLDSAIFTRLAGSPGVTPLDAQLLHIGKRPVTSTDYLIYNPATDLLAYAPDGSASSRLLPIATIVLPGNQALSAADVLILA